MVLGINIQTQRSETQDPPQQTDENTLFFSFQLSKLKNSRGNPEVLNFPCSHRASKTQLQLRIVRITRTFTGSFLGFSVHFTY